MLKPFERSALALFQPEPAPPESASAVDDILPGPSAQDKSSNCAERLQTRSTDLPHNEGHGEATPGTSQPAGVTLTGPASVCLPAPCRWRLFHHLSTA